MRWKKQVCFSLAAAVLSANTGCQPRPDAQRESLSTEKTVVSMMYPQPLNHFEELVERTYPDIDLQVEATTTATINGDSERRLRNDHGTDLVVTTLPTGNVQDYVLDLSAEAYVAGYQSTAINPVMIQGQTRFLPLPGQYSGYIINKTLVEQLGKPMPASNEALLELLDAGKEQGVGIGEDGAMFGIIVVDPAAVGSYIVGTRVPDFLGKMDGIEWMAEFRQGSAGFSGVWDGSLDMLLYCVNKDYLNSRSLSLTTTNVTPVKERMLEGTMLLSYGNVRLLSQLNSESGAYEYKMLPFLSSKGNKPWVLSSPDAYIAINSALEKQGSEPVLDACQRILAVLSTQEGQDAWIADTSATTTYLSDYQEPDNGVPPGLADCVQGGYVYNLQMPSNVIQYFGRNMIDVLDGRRDMAEALGLVDDYCKHGSAEVDYDQSVVGSVAKDLIYENYNTRLEETAIGNLLADAVAEYAGTDIAVVNGGAIRASLYKGDVLGADLTAVCPYANKIVVLETDGSSIIRMLENGISQTMRQDSIPAGRFLQAAGIRYSYRPMTNTEPAVLLDATLADGRAIEPDSRYAVAVSDYMAGSSGYLDNNGDGFTMLNIYSDDIPKAQNVKLLKETDASYADVLKQYFYNHRDEAITGKLEGRITIVNGGG